MAPRPRKARSRPGAPEPGAFGVVRSLGLMLPDVEATLRYDGSPVLRAGGCFMAGLATHPSAEPGTLVVRISTEDRDDLLAEASDTYYLTEHYRPHPTVLVRLARIDRNALRELLGMSWRLTMAKPSARRRRRRERPRT